MPTPTEVGIPRADEERSSEELVTVSGFTLINEMSRMEVIDPELLRATCPSTALQSQVLQKDFAGDLHDRSFQTSRIDCFWSHSWHATPWRKVLVLTIIYNGLAAIVAGHLGALVGTSLFYFQLLPSYPRRFPLEGATYDFGPWGLIFGISLALGTLLLWRPARSRIFLDRICIHQTDLERKAAGICSIGGILKHSDTMLVLWDPTYPTRLWAIFELAAFMKSHGVDALDEVEHRRFRRSLVIRPTFLGPAAMLGVVLLLFVQICTVLATFEDHRINLAIMTLNVMSAALGSHSLRAYFHWVDSCCRQLTQFAVAKAETNCCRVNHVESGKRIACDRETILECVRAWFGSEEAFESMVRHQVSSTLMGLGQGALPVSWFMGMNSCALWIFFDLIVARLRAAEYFYSLAALINMLATVFAFAPLVYLLCLFAAYKLRRPQQHRCSNLTVSFLGAIGVVVIFILYTQLGAIFTPAVPHAVLRSLLLALATALASMLACRMWMATST
ncbi:unnamed protein product [Durusdinium trenchii]|uniref:Uncharacterized protein n=1 Tax=Durusdinium trenchii TaxID=1381693 RepID=A0ABP0P4D8_9DINO